MNQDLQRYFDGELPLEALTTADRAEAERLSALFGAAASAEAAKAPAWLETRVMATLPERSPQVGLWGALAWLTAPKPIRVRPISLALVGAAATLVLFLARPDSQPLEAPAAGGSALPAAAVSGGKSAIVYVQFVFANPAARTVTVAGDFNSWDVAATPLMDTDGDGIWTGRVALRPGMHKYMFVVDGEEWVTDPQADTYVDDGFGMRNAIVTVAQPNGRSI